MFLDELAPLFKELTQHPVSFLGGLCSGFLRLNLNDDPVRSWLEQQGELQLIVVLALMAIAMAIVQALNLFLSTNYSWR